MVTNAVPHLPADLLAEIYRHARAEFPRECCGYIRGVAGELQVVACRNRQDQLHALDPIAYPRTASTAYSIGGRELIDLVRSFETPSPATIIYHSHPRVGAYFSDEDIRAALAAGYPVDYLVVDAQDETIAESRLFRLAADGRSFDQIAVFDGVAI